MLGWILLGIAFIILGVLAWSLCAIADKTDRQMGAK
jgi:hypothetical protein